MIITISGYKGSGKSIVSNVLQQYGYIRLSCASPLKDMVASMFHLDRQLLEGNTEYSRDWREKPIDDLQWLAGNGIFKDDMYITPRILLQRIGTDLCRNHIHNDIWINLLMLRYKHISHTYKDGVPLSDGSIVPYRGIVIDDARFPNEISISNHSILVCRYKYTQNEIDNMHYSETAHIGHRYDTIIDNDGSIEDLIHKVMQLSIL